MGRFAAGRIRIWRGRVKSDEMEKKLKENRNERQPTGKECLMGGQADGSVLALSKKARHKKRDEERAVGKWGGTARTSKKPVNKKRKKRRRRTGGKFGTR